MNEGDDERRIKGSGSWLDDCEQSKWRVRISFDHPGKVASSPLTSSILSRAGQPRGDGGGGRFGRVVCAR